MKEKKEKEKLKILRKIHKWGYLWGIVKVSQGEWENPISDVAVNCQPQAEKLCQVPYPAETDFLAEAEFDNFPSSWASGLGHLGSHAVYVAALLYLLSFFWQIQINVAFFLEREVNITRIFPVKN